VCSTNHQSSAAIRRRRRSQKPSSLDDALPADHPLAKVKAMPAGPAAPQVWLLGSSDYSGALAAQLGLRFAFAHFISADGGDPVMRDYKRKFQPSQRESKPQSLLTVFAICAETDAEADELMVITITGDYRTRLESYELIAGAFGLCQPA
jgi:alkanesulfonate monooxygenase SsuD/methylene tetrahydromethanopterin reductase-like flavin-dependent oxidoreductase (luciferase family)